MKGMERPTHTLSQRFHCAQTHHCNEVQEGVLLLEEFPLLIPCSPHLSTTPDVSNRKDKPSVQQCESVRCEVLCMTKGRCEKKVQTCSKGGALFRVWPYTVHVVVSEKQSPRLQAVGAQSEDEKRCSQDENYCNGV